jgi:TonB family protein
MFVYFRGTLVPKQSSAKIMKLIAKGLWAIFLVLGVQQIAVAQSRREFLDPQHNVVRDSVTAKFIRIVEFKADSLYHVTESYKSGQLSMSGAYLDKELAVAQGPFEFFFANGNKESEGSYKRGNKTGTWKRWDYKGNPKPDKFYPDEFKQRSTRTTKGASFPGGTAALQTFLSDNLKYPDQAFERQLEGIVYVTFVIDAEGDMRNAEISHGVHYLLDDEALRVIASMPDWSPASRNGVPVESNFIMPITFDLKAEMRARGITPTN